MSNLNLWLKEDIEIKTVGQANEYGKHEIINSTKTKGKIEESVKLIIDAKGKEVVAQATIFLFPNINIKIEDKIYTYRDLTEEEVEREYTVIFTSLIKDSRGRTSHWEVLVR